MDPPWPTFSFIVMRFDRYMSHLVLERRSTSDQLLTKCNLLVAIGYSLRFSSEKVCLFIHSVLPWTLVLSLSCCFNVTAQPMKLRLVILYEFVASQCRMNIHYANSRSRSDWLRQPLVSISM